MNFEINLIFILPISIFFFATRIEIKFEEESEPKNNKNLLPNKLSCQDLSSKTPSEASSSSFAMKKNRSVDSGLNDTSSVGDSGTKRNSMVSEIVAM